MPMPTQYLTQQFQHFPLQAMLHVAPGWRVVQIRWRENLNCWLLRFKWVGEP